MNSKPNLIIFNPESFRADALGHLGNSAAITPNLDAMVKTDGVSFRNAFCQNPICGPSRCSFMSGWYPHTRGHRTQSYMMHKDDPVLLKTLKNNGYFVWWGLGKNDLIADEEGNPPSDYCNVLYDLHRRGNKVKPIFGNRRAIEKARGPKGGDNYYSFYVGKIDKGNEEVYYDDDWAIIDGAIDVIKNPPKDQPFCIFLPLSYSHVFYAVEDPWFSMIDRDKLAKRIPDIENWDDKPSILRYFYELYNMKNWTEERWNELRATYLGMCSRVDHQFGMLVDALRQAGAYDDTAIFVLGDHGDFTGDYGLVEKTKNTFYDNLTNVPLIIKPPASTAVKPGISDALVELIDFPATVEDMTGIVPNHTHFGRSLTPIITGEESVHRDAVFCEGGRLYGEQYASCRNHLYTHPPLPVNIAEKGQDSHYWPCLYLDAGEGPYNTKAVMCRTHDYKYVKRLYEKDELYDLNADPEELYNKIDDPKMKDVLAGLKERLMTFYLETCDVVPHQRDSRVFRNAGACI